MGKSLKGKELRTWALRKGSGRAYIVAKYYIRKVPRNPNYLYDSNLAKLKEEA